MHAGKVRKPVLHKPSYRTGLAPGVMATHAGGPGPMLGAGTAGAGGPGLPWHADLITVQVPAKATPRAAAPWVSHYPRQHLAAQGGSCQHHPPGGPALRPRPRGRGPAPPATLRPGAALFHDMVGAIGLVGLGRPFFGLAV